MAGAPVISSRLRGERLGSWKEIAAYLERDLRTVRRWEREKGLPVHRVPGGERRAVFAYRAEIDACFRDRPRIARFPPRTGATLRSKPRTDLCRRGRPVLTLPP